MNSDIKRPLEDTREVCISRAFVQLVDSIVEHFDVIDLLTVLAHRSVELLGAAEAGILLADTEGRLRVMAASSEAIQLLELFQLQNNEGPCRDCYSEGRAIVATDLRTANKWPRFARVAVDSGFPSVCALPLRHKDAVLGSLNLFMAEPLALSGEDIALAQALADVASIAIVQDVSTRQAAVREGQLQHALESRVTIEQAKGMIAQRMQLDMDAAFALLRGFARSHNRGLTEVARSVVTVRGDIEAIIAVKSPASARRGR